MKKLSSLLIILIIFSTFTGCSDNNTQVDNTPSSNTSVTNTNGNNASDSLTPIQKEKDFQYLTDLISKAYPFNEANAKIKGLSELGSLSDDYIERAKNTKDDTEFMELFNEYLTQLSQTGHAYLIKPVHLDYLNSISQDYADYYNSYCGLNKTAKEQLGLAQGIY